MMHEKSIIALPDLVSMKKLLFLLLLMCSCNPKSTYIPQDWNEDTIWIDTFVINKIYNAERMEDIFPSDTMDEGPSYEEWFY